MFEELVKYLKRVVSVPRMSQPTNVRRMTYIFCPARKMPISIMFALFRIEGS